jgi:hypothetical protein
MGPDSYRDTVRWFADGSNPMQSETTKKNYEPLDFRVAFYLLH